MTNRASAVDTNVLIYLHDKLNHVKRAKAQNILAENPKIAVQVISEYLNTARRILDLSKPALLTQTALLLEGCEIIPVLPHTLLFASSLATKYNLQLFDSVIIAASIEGGCSVLYSEDMQHHLVINNTLTIINPFI